MTTKPSQVGTCTYTRHNNDREETMLFGTAVWIAHNDAAADIQFTYERPAMYGRGTETVVLVYRDWNWHERTTT